jgi:hypothetical protein
LDLLWFCTVSFLVLGALGVVIEHLPLGNRVKNRVILLIGGLMLASFIGGVAAIWFL